MGFGNGTKYKTTVANKGFSIAGVPYFTDSFVQGESSVGGNIVQSTSESAFGNRIVDDPPELCIADQAT